MSGYRGHILVYLLCMGLLLGLLYHYDLLHMSTDLLVMGISIGLLYSLLPDIDAPSSKMRRIWGRISLAVIIVCLCAHLVTREFQLIYISIILSLFLYILWFSKHRGIFHTPLMGVALSAPLCLINPYLAGFAFFGFLSHLVVDGEVFG